MTEILEIDNSKRSELVSCPRKYYYNHIRSLEGTIGKPSLRYGTSFHAGMEAYYEYIRLNGWTRDGKAVEASLVHAKKVFEEETLRYPSFWEDFRTLPNLMTALIKYFIFFAGDEGFLEVVSPEKAFKIEITDKKTGITFYFTGKIDLKVKLNGRVWGNEFKTSSYPIVTQTKNIQWSPQILGYTYALMEMDKGEVPDGFLTTLHQISASKVKSGEYGKLKVDFSRPAQVFSFQDIIEWRRMLIHNVRTLKMLQETGYYPLQRDSCHQYEQCTYWRLCEQNAPQGEENTEYFQVKETPWNVINTVKPENVVILKEEGNYDS